MPFHRNEIILGGVKASFNYILDRFTGVDGTLLTAHALETGQAWTARVGNFKILSNRATNNASADAAQNGIITVPTPWSDVSIEVKVNYHTLTGNPLGIILRWTDANNYWYVQSYLAGGNSFRIYKVVAGTPTLMTFANPGSALDTDLTVRVVAFGNTITVTQSSVSPADSHTISTTDAFNNTATTHGLYSGSKYQDGNRMDDFLVWGGNGSPPSNPLYP